SDGEPIGARFVTMRRQVDRLSRLVHVLLDVSRASVREEDLAVEALDLATIARDVVDGLASDAAAAGSTIELVAPAPVRGTWDRLRVEQVLMNLLANALKFGAGGAILVSVESVESVEGGHAVIRVRDHGIGIAPEAQSRVFERFERAVSSRNYPGFGLGLWIVKAIVQAHGGTITVTSAEGQGTTFTVSMPQHRGQGG
ncbi:MAG: HAMP domain-containing sensor histidine kinase, partial [Deltaproteobacteria bacterium]